MTDPRFLLARLASHGVTLRLQDDRLVAVPGSLLSSDDVDVVRRHREAIVAYLQAHPHRGRSLPFRPTCISCGLPIGAGSAVRCPVCVAESYRQRDRRWHEEGRAPPDEPEYDDAS